MLPKTINRNNKEYKLIKEYDKYGIYQNVKLGYKECFSKFELGLIEPIEKPKNISPEKVMYR